MNLYTAICVWLVSIALAAVLVIVFCKLIRSAITDSLDTRHLLWDFAFWRAERKKREVSP